MHVVVAFIKKFDPSVFSHWPWNIYYLTIIYVILKNLYPLKKTIIDLAWSLALLQSIPIMLGLTWDTWNIWQSACTGNICSGELCNNSSFVRRVEGKGIEHEGS